MGDDDEGDGEAFLPVCNAAEVVALRFGIGGGGDVAVVLPPSDEDGVEAAEDVEAIVYTKL